MGVGGVPVKGRKLCGGGGGASVVMGDHVCDLHFRCSWYNESHDYGESKGADHPMIMKEHQHSPTHTQFTS